MALEKLNALLQGVPEEVELEDVVDEVVEEPELEEEEELLEEETQGGLLMQPRFVQQTTVFPKHPTG